MKKDNKDIYLTPQEVDELVEEFLPIVEEELKNDVEFQRKLKTDCQNFLDELEATDDPAEIKKILDKYVPREKF